MTWKLRWREQGGGHELLRIALPLILSNSFWTIQITIDRVLLSRSSSDAVAAAMPAVVLFWTPFILLQNIANYVTTFVAHYSGAQRPARRLRMRRKSIYALLSNLDLFGFKASR